MITYQEAKAKLKSKDCSTKYFNKGFYDLFVSNHLSNGEDIVKGIQSDYDFSPIFETNFYNKNSSSYCVWLEIFNYSLPQWRIDYFADAWSCSHISRQYQHFESKEIARAVGLVNMPDNAKFIEVMKVKQY